jgi:hypothetical protein
MSDPTLAHVAGPDVTVDAALDAVREWIIENGTSGVCPTACPAAGMTPKQRASNKEH